MILFNDFQRVLKKSSAYIDTFNLAFYNFLIYPERFLYAVFSPIWSSVAENSQVTSVFALTITYDVEFFELKQLHKITARRSTIVAPEKYYKANLIWNGGNYTGKHNISGGL